MVSDIWQRTTQIAREVTHCHHMSYSYQLPARFLLYAPSDRIAFVTPVVEHW